MVLKVVFLLFVLTVSQVLAVSVLQLRSLDILAARQDECPTCTSVSNALSACTSTSAPVTCACSAAIRTNAQACINCAIDISPSQSVICTSQDIINSYAKLCPSSPALKLPTGIKKPTGCPVTSSSTSETGSLAAGFIDIGPL